MNLSVKAEYPLIVLFACEKAVGLTSGVGKNPAEMQISFNFADIRFFCQSVFPVLGRKLRVDIQLN